MTNCSGKNKTWFRSVSVEIKRELDTAIYFNKGIKIFKFQRTLKNITNDVSLS